MDPLGLALELLVASLVLIGAGFTCLGSLGLVRLRDLYCRLHTPTKATTLGVGSLLLASSVFFTWQEGGLSLHEILVAVFLFITAPVSAHLIAKAALHLRIRSIVPLPDENVLGRHDGSGEAAPEAGPLGDAYGPRALEAEGEDQPRRGDG
jgi:multicomponent K+:H+ antiporter subunit G